jgi:plastocyanin
LSKSLSSRPRFRALLLAVPAAALSLAFVAPAGAATVAPTGVTAEIDMKFEKGKMFFSGPKTVTQGDTLKIVNETNPKQIGPHTFSLATKGSLPKTKDARKSCFTPKHICLSIAEWHKFNPKTEKIALDPVKAGPAGWSTMGNNSKTGDSWFTEKKGESFEQQVTATPGTLYYLCAVHSFMQGQVKVVAPTVAPSPVP